MIAHHAPLAAMGRFTEACTIVRITKFHAMAVAYGLHPEVAAGSGTAVQDAGVLAADNLGHLTFAGLLLPHWAALTPALTVVITIQDKSVRLGLPWYRQAADAGVDIIEVRWHHQPPGRRLYSMSWSHCQGGAVPEVTAQGFFSHIHQGTPGLAIVGAPDIAEAGGVSAGNDLPPLRALLPHTDEEKEDGVGVAVVQRAGVHGAVLR